MNCSKCKYFGVNDNYCEHLSKTVGRLDPIFYHDKCMYTLKDSITIYDEYSMRDSVLQVEYNDLVEKYKKLKDAHEKLLKEINS